MLLKKLNIPHHNGTAYFLVISILFVSARSSLLAIHHYTLIFIFLFTLLTFLNLNIKLTSTIKWLLVLYVVSISYYLLDFGWVNLELSIRMLMIILIGYMTARILGYSFFLIYEKVLYSLVLISLILFPIQLLYFPLLTNILKTITAEIPFHYYSDQMLSIIIWGIDLGGAEMRNSGFAWEPKAFANFIILGILINLINNKFKLNKRILVYYIALITTFSTVGYLIGFVLIPLFWLINKELKHIIILIPIVFLITFYIIQLDFVGDKILKEWNLRYNYTKMLNDSRYFETGSRSLGRTPSLMLDLSDFSKKPLFGYGMQKSERSQNPYVSLIRVNGFSDWLASFGLVGFFLLIMGILKTWKIYLKYNDLKGVIIILLIFFSIYFATTLTIHPFWMVLLFLFDSKKQK